MGWGRTLFLGDIGNRLDIADTERDIAKLRNDISSAYHRDMSQDQKIEFLLNENAELKLYLVSLIRLMTSKGVISPEELETIVQAVDAEDGSVDGGYKGNIT